MLDATLIDPVEDEAGAALRSMISDSAVAPAAMAELLDGLSEAMRTRIVRQLGRRDQQALYGKVEGFAPVELIDLVPPDRSDLEEVRCAGRLTEPRSISTGGRVRRVRQ